MTEATSITSYLSSRPYPGRGLVLSRSRNGAVTVSIFLTGRSHASQARKLVLVDSALEVVSTDGASDDPLWHYSAIVARGSRLVAGNGRQVSDIAASEKGPAAADGEIRRQIYEPDPPIFTPRLTAGEKITTTLEGGAKETVNKASEGDWIMTNPGGEQHIISEKKFLGRYEVTDESGVYSAKGYCRAIPNPFGKPIEIMASWGSPQTGDERCLIADTCDASGKVDGEPYLIDADAFTKTYKQVEAQE